MLEKDLGDVVIKYCQDNEIHYVPEFGHWDLVCQYHGILLGIQLKLDLNIKAITQCIQCGGVDFKAIIFSNKVGRNKVDQLFPILRECKIIPITGHMEVHPMFFTFRKNNWMFKFRHHPKKYLEPPNHIFNLPAGSQSPITISQWKINCCQLEKLAKSNGGWVLRETFRLMKMNTPREYFRFNHDDKKWYLYRDPSKDYPYIWEAINKE